MRKIFFFPRSALASASRPFPRCLHGDFTSSKRSRYAASSIRLPTQVIRPTDFQDPTSSRSWTPVSEGPSSEPVLRPFFLKTLFLSPSPHFRAPFQEDARFWPVFKKRPGFGPFFVRSPVLCPFFTESPFSDPDFSVAYVISPDFSLNCSLV